MPSKAQRDKRQAKKIQSQFGPSSIQFEPVVAEIDTVQAAGDDTTQTVPRFSAVAYSGGKLFVKGFRHPVVVDLSGLEINANASILLDHDSRKRVGHPESIRIDGQRILADGVISAKTDYATEVVASAKDGFRWHVSIGARILAAYEVPEGKRALINGQEHSGPIVVATRSRLNEISFVGVGGDEFNEVRIAAAADLSEVSDMNFKEWLVANNFDPEVVSGTQEAVLLAAYNANSKDDGERDDRDDDVSKRMRSSEPDVTDPIALIRASAANESRRIQAVRKICGDQFQDIAAEAIENGWDETKTELAVLRAEREVVNAQAAPAGHVRSQVDAVTSAKALEASLCLQFGMSEERAGKSFDDKVMQAAVSREYRNLSLHNLIYRTLQAHGRHYRAGVMDDDTIRDFLHIERDLQAHSPGTLSHLSTTGILSNTANKMLMDAYLAVNTIVPRIFGSRSVNDFKQHSSYRLAANGELEEVTAGGEIRHADLTEDSYTNQATTWGKMLTLSRKDIINDDLGAFEQIPRILGRKAALKLEKEGIQLLLDPPAGYFVNTVNSFTGANTELQITSLTTAEQALMDQVDASGDPVLLNGRYLVVGTALGVTAAQLMTETRIIATDYAAAASTVAPASNPHAGKWVPLVSPYLNSQGLTNGSATIWYLLADPMDVPGFVVSYLNGRTSPMIESSEVNFDRLGMSWRVVFDFGVDAQDSRAAIQMIGA